MCHAVRAPGSKVTLPALKPHRVTDLKHWLYANRAGEISLGPFGGRARSVSFDVHSFSPLCHLVATDLCAKAGPEPSINAKPPDAQSRRLRVSLQLIACTCRSIAASRFACGATLIACCFS